MSDSIPEAPPFKFKAGWLVQHVKTLGVYLITMDRDSGLILESTREPAYAYTPFDTNKPDQTGGRQWIRAAAEFEDGRFVFWGTLEERGTGNYVRKAFVEQMRHELEANAHKGSWAEWKPVPETALAELGHHYRKLGAAMATQNRAKVSEYSADCANVLMKIDEIYGNTEGPVAPDASQDTFTDIGMKVVRHLADTMSVPQKEIHRQIAESLAIIRPRDPKRETEQVLLDATPLEELLADARVLTIEPATANASRYALQLSNGLLLMFTSMQDTIAVTVIPGSVPAARPPQELSVMIVDAVNTPPPPGKIAIETNAQRVSGNFWVKEGMWYNAMFVTQPPEVKGCPSGRSQVSEAEAIQDLVLRTNLESGTTYKVEDFVVTLHNGEVVCPPPAEVQGRLETPPSPPSNA